MIIDKENSTITFDNLTQNPTGFGEKPHQQPKIDIKIFCNESHQGDFPNVNSVDDLEVLYEKGLETAGNTLKLLRA